MLDPTLSQRIRAIFLHHEARVTVGEAAGMLGWTRGEMDAAIANGEIEVVGAGSGTRIERRELAEVALQRWSLVTIEEALGRDAASILPPGLRTRKFTVRLPRYQIGALQVLAEDGREPVEAMLMAGTAGSVGWHSLGRHSNRKDVRRRRALMQSTWR
jgi:hypothetical protein